MLVLAIVGSVPQGEPTGTGLEKVEAEQEYRLLV